MDILVTYDVATITPEGERRLAQVAAVCERFGVRAQYSVFECRLSPTSLQRFAGELMDVMDASEDSIHIYRFDRPIPEVRWSLGRERRSLAEPWVIDSDPRMPSDP